MKEFEKPIVNIFNLRNYDIITKSTGGSSGGGGEDGEGETDIIIIDPFM